MVWWSIWAEGLSDISPCLLLSPSSYWFFWILKEVFLLSSHSFDRQFLADEVLQLLDRFYNIEMLVSNPWSQDLTIVMLHIAMASNLAAIRILLRISHGLICFLWIFNRNQMLRTLTFLTTRKTLPCLRVSLIWKNSDRRRRSVLCFLSTPLSVYSWLGLSPTLNIEPSEHYWSF